MHVADRFKTEQLHSRADATTDNRRLLYIRAGIWHLESCTAPESAAALGCSRRAAEAWGRPLQRRGGRRLGWAATQRLSFLDDVVLAKLRARWDAALTATDVAWTLRGPEIRTLLECKFGVPWSPAAFCVLLHRLGDSCLDPGPRHRNADPEAREAFKKVADHLDEVTRDHPGTQDKVWFEDEARFGEKGDVATVWAHRGSWPTAVRQTQYDSLLVSGATYTAT